MDRKSILAVAAACAALAGSPFTAQSQPGEDFFLYANVAWDKATEIPADRSSWGGNAILSEQVDKDVRAIIEGAASSGAAPGSGSGWQKARRGSDALTRTTFFRIRRSLATNFRMSSRAGMEHCGKRQVLLEK